MLHRFLFRWRSTSKKKEKRGCGATAAKERVKWWKMRGVLISTWRERESLGKNKTHTERETDTHSAKCIVFVWLCIEWFTKFWHTQSSCRGGKEWLEFFTQPIREEKKWDDVVVSLSYGGSCCCCCIIMEAWKVPLRLNTFKLRKEGGSNEGSQERVKQEKEATWNMLFCVCMCACVWAAIGFAFSLSPSHALNTCGWWWYSCEVELLNMA